MKFIIRDREAGNKIAEFGTLETLEEARAELEAFEATDKSEGTYTEDFYEIVDTDGNIY